MVGRITVIGSIVTDLVSFASTNIDDIFVLMVFYSQVGNQLKKHHIIMGQYLGVGILITVSVLGSFGLNIVPQQYTGLLGVIPISLGIKEWIGYKKDKESTSNSIIETQIQEPILTGQDEIADDTVIDSYDSEAIHPAILNVALVTLANGADNIGIYISLFTRTNTYELIITIVIFILMIALWCFVGEKLANYPVIKHIIQKYKHIVVPLVFIGIGIFILLESGISGRYVCETPSSQ